MNARKRPGDIDLGLGEPTLKPPVEKFLEALKWVERNGCPYTANAGDPGLRRAIARRYNHPRLSEAENVCITVGSQEALFLAIKTLCTPGQDEVLIVEPAYPAYGKICQLENIAVHRVCLSPQTGFAPDAERVLAAVTPVTRLIILASPANPTGRVWKDDAQQALAEGLNRFGDRRPWVLIDEVYRELCYVDPRPQSFAHWYDRTLLAGSLSKSHALTGLRLGWLIAPRQVIEAASKAHQFLVTAASTFSQQVAMAIFSSPEPLDAARGHYRQQRQFLIQELERLRLSYIIPEGAFYALLALPPHAQKNSLDTAIGLLENQRVLTIPGSAFGAEDWLRISWVAPASELRTGLERLAAHLVSPSQLDTNLTPGTNLSPT